MNAIGLCQHNNPGYCPSCHYNKSRGMGIVCQDGFYEFNQYGIDQCLPSSSSALSIVGGSLTSATAAAAAGNPANQAVGIKAGLSSLTDYAVANPAIAAGVVIGAILLLRYA